MKETEEIQKKIEASGGLEPIDKEVVVLYEEEALVKQSEFVNVSSVLFAQISKFGVMAIAAISAAI